jgi:hypothetical protein
MDNKEIEVPVPASDSEDSIRSRDNSIDGSSIPSRVSDVGRGINNTRNNHTHQQPILNSQANRSNPVLTQSPKDQHYPIRHFQQSLSEVIAPPNMDGSGKVIRYRIKLYILKLLFYNSISFISTVTYIHV